MALAIEFADEMDGSKVFTASHVVRDPFPFLARIVQVEHRRNGIDAESIDMELIEPKQRIGYQKVTNFVSRVIEHHGAPIGMLALARVFVFVKSSAIEAIQAMSVSREVSRYPVDDHADGVLMAVVDKVHEIFGTSVATCD